AGFKQKPAEIVLVQNKNKTVADPEFRATVDKVVAKLETLPQLEDIRSPLAPGRVGVISKDRHSAIVQFTMRDDSDPKVQQTHDTVDRLQQDSPGFTVGQFGFASADHELGNTIDKDFQRAERLTVPITFLILLFAFGAFVAAGVPVLLAFTAVLASIGLAEL